MQPRLRIVELFSFARLYWLVGKSISKKMVILWPFSSKYFWRNDNEREWYYHVTGSTVGLQRKQLKNCKTFESHILIQEWFRCRIAKFLGSYEKKCLFHSCYGTVSAVDRSNFQIARISLTHWWNYGII